MSSSYGTRTLDDDYDKKAVRKVSSSLDGTSDDDDDDDEAQLADRLSTRLLAIDDEHEQDRIVRESLHLVQTADDDTQQRSTMMLMRRSSASLSSMMRSSSSARRLSRASLLLNMDEEEDDNLRANVGKHPEQTARRRMCTMLCFAAIGLGVLMVTAHVVSIKVVGPPNQPVGPYELVELQEGSRFFDFYSFFDGKDSAGSAGYNTYVSRARAQALGIVNVSMEMDEFDVFGANDNDVVAAQGQSQSQSSRQEQDQNHRRQSGVDETPDNKRKETTASEPDHPRQRAQNETVPDKEPFIYMGSAPTADGPRESIRLEGIRRFNRGLFIIDVRHMPAGCGVWPAFWLVDEANWPLNGEMDIVEGVNYQSQAKTALHSTDGCTMDNDIPYGVMTGGWDSAQGIPNAKTGIPDMTMRYAKNCFVYDQHQWLNQGCVAVSERNDTLGGPLNANGGGVFALEWDPMNRHIRSWVFSPHSDVPDNVVESIRTAHLTDTQQRVMPNPELWPLPYAYFAIGEGTSCPSTHFRNMRLVFNTAFCGSVAGNRFQMDCPVQAKKFKTCNDYLQSEPEELNEAYWKIRGVYVYERQWERIWLN